jgi:hypothetical protein
MALPHPTICLHKDVFHFTSEVSETVSTTVQRNSETLLRAAT